MTKTDWKRAMREGFSLIKEQYQIIGGPMTVRRVFYLFVSAVLIKNNHSQYQYLSNKLARAREKGVVPWKWIYDGVRSIQGLEVLEPEDMQLPDPEWYMSDPTSEQDNYVEVWVEKAGNIPILSPVCKNYFVRLVSTGGRTSVTYKHLGANRFRRYAKDIPGTILYVSDLDADGEHFPIETQEYLEAKEGISIDVKKIILTYDQVKKYDLPILANDYHKSMDKGFVRDFVNEYGAIQVEIDALSVGVMRQTLEAELSQLLSLDVIEEVRDRSVEAAEAKLNQLVADFEG